MQKLLPEVITIAQQAGEAILDIYNSQTTEVVYKADNLPLTNADQTAHNIIVEGLSKLTPNTPIYSEESDNIPYAERKSWSEFWLVDPLDGTKEFIKRNGEFTVNIALVQNQTPVLGVVHVPVTNVTYTGSKETGAHKQEQGSKVAIQCRELQTPVIMVASRSHGSDKLQALQKAIEKDIGPVKKRSMGSSLKLCLVAEGKADIYPRLAPTSEWDTAAAHAVVLAAGGVVVNTQFEPLAYNKENILNPYFLVVNKQSQPRWEKLF